MTMSVYMALNNQPVTGQFGLLNFSFPCTYWHNFTSCIAKGYDWILLCMTPGGIDSVGVMQ